MSPSRSADLQAGASNSTGKISSIGSARDTRGSCHKDQSRYRACAPVDQFVRKSKIWCRLSKAATGS